MSSTEYTQFVKFIFEAGTPLGKIILVMTTSKHLGATNHNLGVYTNILDE